MRHRLARVRAAWMLAAAAVPLAAGCTSPQSILAPHSVDTDLIAGLGWAMIGIASVVVFVVIVLTVTAALWSGSATSDPTNPAVPQMPAKPHEGMRVVIIGGIVLPFLILASVLGYTLYVMSATDRPLPALANQAQNALTIRVIGHQYWWEVYYPQYGFETANEIHLPPNQPVRLDVSTADVIHSVWVPELMGKIDTIPGKVNTVWLRPTQVGTYRGQCAEFCGLQHAHMALFMMVETPDVFNAWLAAQQRPAQSSVGQPLVARGRQVFLAQPCWQCHTIKGVSEFGNLGPDLTHLVSRRTIAAGLLPNTVGNLGGWIENSQALKPGNLMPPMPLSGDDLQALIAYLSTLQ